MRVLWITFRFVLVLAFSSSALASTYTQVVYETDGTTQTKRAISLFVIFKQGEITSGNCARPVVGGVAVADGSWQEDRKTSYSNGDAETGIVTYQGTLSSGGSNTVTFQNGTCSNTPLSAAAMSNFDTGQGAGVWDGQFSVTPKGGSAYTQNIKAMLTDNDPNSNTYGDCKNNFWLKGPVVTAVIVQDCTAASKWDFGWHWSAGVMIGADGNPHTAPYTANSQWASLHPYAVVYFYPSLNSSTATIRIDAILENDWTGRAQDQSIDNYTFKTYGTGAAFSNVYARSPNFTMVWGTNYRKMGWSGTPLGNVRVDVDFVHLRESHAIPYYDLGTLVKQHVTTGTDSVGDSGCATSYATWAAGDKGDFGATDGGIVAISQDFAANCEGAPMQREHLLYLYNMNASYSADGGNAGTANGEAAKAWMMLTGTKGTADSTLTTAVAGGAGVWGNAGNIPFHGRESRTAASGAQSNLTNYFFCGDKDNPATKGFDDKNAAGDKTNCTDSVSQPSINNATGRFVSRHAHSEAQYGPGLAPYPATNVGDITNGGWAISGCNHWQDWVYPAYLLTGDYYYLQETFAQASFCASRIAPDNSAYYDSHGFFAYSNPLVDAPRGLAWSILEQSNAWFAAPDGTPEKWLYASYVRSNLEVQEGVQSLTGTDLTPSVTHPNCDVGSASTWNRWDFGRCGVMSLCSSTTSQVGQTVSSCTPRIPHRHEIWAGGSPAGSYSSSGDNTNMVYANTINVRTSCGIQAVATVSGGVITAITVPPGGTGSGCSGASTCLISSNVGSGATCSITDNTTVNVTAGGSGYITPTSRNIQQPWMANYLIIALGQSRLLGVTQARYAHADAQKWALEYMLDSTSNKYIIANFSEAQADATGAATRPACNGGSCDGESMDPFFTNWANWLNGHPTCLKNVNTYDPYYLTTASCPGWTPQVGTNHAYTASARAAISTAPYFGTSSSDANCPSGTCTAAAAWSAISDNTVVPYFNNTAAQSLHSPCCNNDFLVKFAIDSEAPSSPNGSIQTPNTIRTAGTVMQ